MPAAFAMRLTGSPFDMSMRKCSSVFEMAVADNASDQTDTVNENKAGIEGQCKRKA
jgi:hypothetical protein